MTRLPLCLLACLLLAAAPALTAPAVAATVASYDFDSGVPEQWSGTGTLPLGSGKALGLFNNRNPRTMSETRLTLTGLPAGTAVEVAFDLYLIGSWDSGGALADRFQVLAGDGAVLLDLKEFPCAIEGDDEEKPINATGRIKVTYSDRTLGYWRVAQKLVVDASHIQGGKLVLQFKGETTARKVEFWALDNVRVSTP